MSKYGPLGEFLRKQHKQEVPMTFAEIERVTGTKLPRSAMTYRPWWSNTTSNNVMTKVWLEAGYKSERVDMAARKLVFRRVKPERDTKSETTPESRPATFDRHPLCGILKDVTHTPPGVDLTEPADPAWADWLDKKYGPMAD